MTQGLFQFNNSIINEIINFSISPLDLFFISGPKGSSKSETIEKVIPELEEKNLIFRHFCFENTVIDDFLLNFYDALKSFSLAQKISLKKFTTDNFKEKVSHYFKTINSNCIIIVENFEKIQENIEVIDFLSHLASYNNVKIIILTRNSEKNLFRFKEIKMITSKIEPITKEDFKSKLTILTEPIDFDLKEKFYEITNGSELYLNMCIRYCSNTGISITDLISEFDRKNISFEKFIVTKFISLTPNAYRELFKILCIISNPISYEFIEEYQLGSTDYIEYLYKNFLINKFQNEIYVKDYFKQYMLETFSIQDKVNYYKNITNIFENELTKSPKDRLLRLSRESIRKEIEYFKLSTPAIKNSDNKSISYIGISNLSINNSSNENKNNNLTEKLNKIKERKKILSSKKSNNLIIEKQSENINDNQKNRNIIVEHINLARNLTKNYKYKEADIELKKALELDFNNEFNIELLILIAKNYEYLNEYNIAQKYYEQALQFAKSKQDTRRCEIEFSIALTNKNLYKTNIAREQLKEIILNEQNSIKYRAMASIELGEIDEANSNLENAIKHYENALSFSLGKFKNLACKSYYHLAILYDENQDYNNAIKYYKKNYMTSSDKTENKYYSISLTNLALICIEQSQYREASEYLKMALIFDSENNDLENMYFSQKELAKLYAKFDSQSAIGYFKQALDCANKLKDSFKIALIYFEAGEFFYDNNEDEKALNSFLNAKKALKSNEKDENTIRINSRISDIKMRLDKTTYNLILEKYDK